jgi:hypothetical protein
MLRPSPLVPLWLIACAAPTSEQSATPRGPRASDHLAIADRENRRGDELMRWPDTGPGAEPGPHLTPGAWSGRWDTVAEHRRIAQLHRGKAAQLDAAYEEACGTASAAEVSVSPLQRYGIGSSEAPAGATVILSPDVGTPATLLASMRCHRAWMMLGRSQMDDCPLDLPGIHVDAHGDAAAIELTISIDDPALVSELRRRVARDLEAAPASRRR